MPTKKIIDSFPYISYSKAEISAAQMQEQSSQFLDFMQQRRTVREFSNKAIDKKVIENIIATASTAPSGAHKQPWTFCVVSNADLKTQIRIAAEQEEKESYEGRMSDEWLKDLKPLGTDWQKPFLEIAPYLIVVFKQSYGFDENKNKTLHYYVNESVGIAVGFLLAAIHQAGLVALTHTPSPMNFLTSLLKRPNNEKPFLLIPIGHVADECFVPDIERKSVEEIIIWHE